MVTDLGREDFKRNKTNDTMKSIKACNPIMESERESEKNRRITTYVQKSKQWFTQCVCAGCCTEEGMSWGAHIVALHVKLKNRDIVAFSLSYEKPKKEQAK